MFQFSFRVKPGAVLCCAAALGLLAAVGAAVRSPAAPTDAAAPVSLYEAADDPALARHIAFLASCGWAVSAAPLSVEDVTIPAVFGAVYERYNRLQLAQGFDLSPFRGKTVKKYVYGIQAYPGAGADGDVRANVLEYAGRVIGGDISSVRIDGFMHGFRGETDGSDQT